MIRQAKRKPRLEARILLSAALFAAAAAASQAAPTVDKVPPIRLHDLDGRISSVGYEEAAVTLVNFWATWCLPCREEMPQIEKLSQKYGQRGFRAVGIALESGEAEDVRDFLMGGKFDLSYTLLLGNDDVSDAFGGIEIVPTTFLVGRDGRILSRHLGVTEGFEARIEAEIEQHLPAAEGVKGASAP